MNLLGKGKSQSDKDKQRINELNQLISENNQPIREFLQHPYEDNFPEFEKIKASEFPRCTFILKGNDEYGRPLNRLVHDFLEYFVDYDN